MAVEGMGVWCLFAVCFYGKLSERERRKGFAEALEIEVFIYREKGDVEDFLKKKTVGSL